MESESAKPALNGANAAGHSPSDDANRKQAQQETVASSSSSFRGLIGGTGPSLPGSSFEKAMSGQREFDQSIVGRTFGRYRIQKVLGSGSMGSVFLAHDSQLNRDVALKMPRFEHDSKGELSERLYREARAAAVLNHPNICPIYDVSEHEGLCFIAMGFVKGEPLSTYVASKKRQPEREAAKVVRKIALALEEAHTHGILHRDLKPTNIMIDKRGEPIVMDFGVACWFDDQTQTRLTQQGAIVGTPAYMSPEQIEGRVKVGPTSDVYSLGVLFYQILTGRCPFEGTVLNVISQVLHQTPPPATKFRSDLSPELVAICERAMRKNPADRFPTMHDFAKALSAYVNRRLIDEKSPKASAEADTIEVSKSKVKRRARPPRTSAPVLPVLPRRQYRPPKKRRSGWFPVAITVGSVAVLLLIGAFFGAFFERGSGSAATAAKTPTDSSDQAPKGSSAIEPPKTGLPVSSTRPPAVDVTEKDKAAQGSSPAASGRTSPAPQQAGTSPQATVNPPSKVTATNSRSKPTPASNSAGNNRGSTPTVAAPQMAATKVNSRSPGPEDGGDVEGSPPEPRGERGRAKGPEQRPGPMRGRPGGMPAFDGGPARGMSMETYFKKLDANGDEKLDPSELPMHVILRADTNKDGELTLHELVVAFRKRGKRLFMPPTASEMRRLPPGGPQPPFGGPQPPRGGGQGGL